MEGKGEIRVFYNGGRTHEFRPKIWPRLIHYMEKGQEYHFLSNHGKYLRASDRNDLGLRVQYLIKYKVFC